MKKTAFILMTIIMVATLLAGCGAAMTEESVDNGYTKSGGQNLDYVVYENSAAAPAPVADGSIGFNEEGEGYYEEGRKAIKTGEANLEVINFQAAYDAIKSMIGNSVSGLNSVLLAFDIPATFLANSTTAI